MSIWGDITGGVEKAAKDVGGAVAGVPQAGGNIIHDIVHFLANQQVPGSQVPGMGGPTTFGQAVGQAGKTVGIGGGGKKPADPAAATPPQPTATKQPTAQAPDDVFTAGLGMFFSQYLAPMMQQISQRNNSMINQWGDTMNQLLQQPLPAGVAAIMKPWVAQNAQTLGMINQAGAEQLYGQGNFNTLMNQLGQESSAQQALATALPTAAANQMLGGGGGAQGVAQMLANQGLANTPIGGAVLSLLSQPSLLQSLTGQQGKGSTTGTSSTAQTNPQSITPIQVLPSATPTAASATNQAASQTNNLANTLYAQQLAQAMMNANQPSAQQANTSAASGYTP